MRLSESRCHLGLSSGARILVFADCGKCGDLLFIRGTPPTHTHTPIHISIYLSNLSVLSIYLSICALPLCFSDSCSVSLSHTLFLCLQSFSFTLTHFHSLSRILTLTHSPSLSHILTYSHPFSFTDSPRMQSHSLSVTLTHSMLADSPSLPPIHTHSHPHLSLSRSLLLILIHSLTFILALSLTVTQSHSFSHILTHSHPL